MSALTPPEGRRKRELSALNVLFCLMVAFYHIASATLASLDRLGLPFAALLVLQRLACVSLPGFFFLSGLKLTLPSPGQARSLPRYYLNRANRLLVPYVLAAAVHYLVFVRLGWYAPSLGDFIRLTLRGSLSAQFYFVIVLVQFTLLAPVFRQLAERFSPLILLPPALVITQCSGQLFAALAQRLPNTPLQYYTGSIFTNFLFYYLAGCCAGARYEAFRALLAKNRPLILAMALIFTCADQAGSVLQYSGRTAVPTLDSLHLLYYIGGILFLCALPAPRWAGAAGKLMRAVDRASYLIYLYHCLVITLFNLYAPDLGLSGTGVQFLARTAVTYAVTTGGCILWQRLWSAARGIVQMKKGD